MYQPTLHKPVPMGARVKITENSGYPPVSPGTVVGVASVHILFHYIVLLDTPFDTEYGPQRALSVPGTHLETEDGLTNFRLER